MPTLTIKNYRRFSSENPAKIELGKGFTALVGVNNSGKSSILRFFFEYRALFRILENVDVIQAGLRGLIDFQFPTEIRDPNEVFHRGNTRPMEIVFDWPELNATEFRRATITIARLTRLAFTVTLTGADGIVLDGAAYSVGLGSIENAKGYMDVAQLADAAALCAGTFYVGPFRNALEAQFRTNNTERYFDIQIGSAFVSTWRNLKMGTRIADADLAYRLKMEIATIFQFDDFEIDPSADGGLRLRINHEHFNLSEVGAGLTEFLVVLVNAAIAAPRLILIDEPELHLHPRMQLEFLSALGGYASDGVVFATHNLGLARSYSDRMYALQPVGADESRIEPYDSVPLLTEFLGALGYAGGQDGGASQILLVEGKTDIKVINEFIRKIRRQSNVVLLPLGGGNLISGDSQEELLSLARLSPNVSALIDSERVASEAEIDDDRLAFMKACEVAGIRCKVLDRRATENYLSDSAVKAAFGSHFRGLAPYEALHDLPNGWSKSENWRIARRMTRDELLDSDLGQFLDEFVLR